MATYKLHIYTTIITSYTQNSPFNIYIGDDYVEDITNNIIVWTYSGTGTFLGLSRNGGTSTPDYGIGSTILINNSDVTTTYYKVASVPTRKWLLNQNITDLVPDGSDFQHLDFNYNYYAPTETISSYCTLVMIGVMSPFSTWQQFVTQLPSALEALGLTDVSSTLDASNVPSDFKLKLKSPDCEFLGNESDGYWFGSNYGYDVLEGPNITGTISLTYEGDSYTLTLLELDTAMREIFGMPLFDGGGMTYYDIDAGYFFDRTWEITGGEDADDAVFYNWLQNNAIEIVGPQYISSIDISNKNYLFKDNELRLALEEFIDLLPVPTIADSGKYLGVDSTGHLALISPTPSGPTLTITTNIVGASIEVYYADYLDTIFDDGGYIGTLTYNNPIEIELTNAGENGIRFNLINSGGADAVYCNIDNVNNSFEVIVGSFVLVTGEELIGRIGQDSYGLVSGSIVCEEE